MGAFPIRLKEAQMVKRRTFLFTLCTLFLLPFCATAQNADNVQFLPVSDWQKMQEKQNPSSVFAAAVFKVFYAALKGINDKYIKPVSFAELIVSGLNELDTIDPSLVTTPEADSIVILHESTPLISMPFSPKDGPEKWARTLTSAMSGKANRHRSHQQAGRSLVRSHFPHTGIQKVPFVRRWQTELKAG